MKSRNLDQISRAGIRLPIQFPAPILSLPITRKPPVARTSPAQRIISERGSAGNGRMTRSAGASAGNGSISSRWARPTVTSATPAPGHIRLIDSCRERQHVADHDDDVEYDERTKDDPL